MSWWQRLFRGTRPLGPAQSERVKHYRALPEPDLGHSFRATRFVVVDVESSGLRPHRDRLLAIGALAVVEDLVRLDAAFEVVLRQTAPSAHGNILIHGIDGTTQISGRDPAEALVEFLDYCGKGVLVGFHANFDRVMITRATKDVLGTDLENRWLDLAVLAPELLPQHSLGASTLDNWSQRLGLDNPARHNALADALVTAQLLQVTLVAAHERGLKCSADLMDIERAGRWLEAHR